MKLKLPNFLPRKKLRATTARRSLGLPDEVDYEEMAEPNMKLSRALLIVLVLHVVAVAGIVAFNTIKTRQAGFPAPDPAMPKGAASPAIVEEEKAPVKVAFATETGKKDSVKAVHAQEKVIAKTGPKPDATKQIEKPAVASAGAKTYVVAKGDNPVKIAKKLKVSEDELLAANHIDDPHKLQIGQKLIVPTKRAPKAKKTAE